jgi:hypothetical protein
MDVRPLGTVPLEAMDPREIIRDAKCGSRSRVESITCQRAGATIPSGSSLSAGYSRPQAILAPVVAIDMVFSFRVVAFPRILVNCGTATTHDLVPAAQERSTRRSMKIRQPAFGAVRHVLPFGRGNAVGRTLQNNRIARPTVFWQENERIQPDTVPHLHHRLKATGSVNCVYNFPLHLIRC